jgi:hypothetical protein
MKDIAMIRLLMFGVPTGPHSLVPKIRLPTELQMKGK